MDDVKKYNKLNKNREVMLGSDNGGDKWWDWMNYQNTIISN
jgi:hypothetical protein